MPTDEDRDALALLTARVMTPARPSLAACLRQITGAPDAACDLAAASRDPLQSVVSWLCGRGRAWPGHQDPREAWEVLCPAAWVTDAARGFVGADEAWRDSPPDLGAALTLASDPEGVLAAEDLARVVVQELRAVMPELASPRDGGFDRVWRVVPARAWRAPYTRAAGDIAGALRHEALAAWLPGGAVTEAHEVEVRAVRAGAMPRVGGCGWDASVIAAWSLAARGTAREGLFTALRALWSTGYALEQVRGGACVLVAPRVG